jgi:hypothetical protein
MRHDLFRQHAGSILDARLQPVRCLLLVQQRQLWLRHPGLCECGLWDGRGKYGHFIRERLLLDRLRYSHSQFAFDYCCSMMSRNRNSANH